jgi:hypothetical protein
MSKLKWQFIDNIINRKWELIREDGTNAATVYDNGLWHTWDRSGGGGENWHEKNVDIAKAEAMLSVVNQGFI